MKPVLRSAIIISILVLFGYCEEKDILPNSDGIIVAPKRAEAGDTYDVNGITYTVVDNAMLYEMVENEEDVTKVITTLVTDMYRLFEGRNFNQDISSWDVSNVTDMKRMFFYNCGTGDDCDCGPTTKFNQDISSWDVSNVKYMGLMFYQATTFNQDLSSWDVDNVLDCEHFTVDCPSWTLPKPNFTNCDPN